MEVDVMLTYGSLFSGIGGFDLGFDRAGMTCKWQVDNNEFCQKVLNKHWPDVPKYKDIRDVGRKNLETVDVICGGFPCQPFSVAGKQGGTTDDRHLWPEMLRVIAELKPTWVVGENVPGIINIFLDQAVSDLENQGYTCETIVLPACAFDAWHKRERVFVIAYRDSKRQSWLKNGWNNRNMVNERPSLLFNARKPNEITKQNVSDTDKQRLEGYGKLEQSTGKLYTTKSGIQPEQCAKWLSEPDVGRVANGVPNRVDRLRSLGNAIVPQVAEFIGRQIMKAHTQSQSVV